MVDTGTPHDVVALAIHGLTAAGDLDPERAGDEENQRRALVIGGPFRKLVTRGMVGPLDFVISGAVGDRVSLTASPE